jgi:hypothetical protein
MAAQRIGCMPDEKMADAFRQARSEGARAVVTSGAVFARPEPRSGANDQFAIMQKCPHKNINEGKFPAAISPSIGPDRAGSDCALDTGHNNR